MVKEHFDAFLFIKTQAVKKRKFSVEFFKKMAALVMKNTRGPINQTVSQHRLKCLPKNSISES
jgi:hypothetical protein